jgi:hypothetical protein
MKKTARAKHTYYNMSEYIPDLSIRDRRLILSLTQGTSELLPEETAGDGDWISHQLHADYSYPEELDFSQNQPKPKDSDPFAYQNTLIIQANTYYHAARGTDNTRIKT